MSFKTAPLRRKPPKPVQPVVGRVMDVAGAAAYLGVSERWIRRRIDRRLIPCRKFVGRYIFLRAELEQFLADLPGTSLAEAKKNLDIRNGDEG